MLASALFAAATLCAPLTPAGLRQLVAAHSPLKVVFFASWCGECKESLSKPQPAGTIAVAAFDEPEAAEAAVRKLGVKLPCYVDQGVAEELKVKSVPNERMLP